MHLRIVLVTAPSEKTAKELAAQAVESALAACVSIIPGITSVYYWDGKVHSDNEVQLLFKTSEEKIPFLKDFIHEFHPYECPEFMVLDTLSVENEYAKWISETLERNTNKDE